MDLFDTLSAQETAELLKFPAYISMLAAFSNDKLDDVEKESAIKFTHIKTFTCDPLLVDFYKEADRVFESTISQLDNSLPKEPKTRDTVIKKELANIEKIALKLGAEYAEVMHRSMESFTKHISKAHHHVLEDFIFPVPITGLTD